MTGNISNKKQVLWSYRLGVIRHWLSLLLSGVPPPHFLFPSLLEKHSLVLDLFSNLFCVVWQEIGCREGFLIQRENIKEVAPDEAETDSPLSSPFHTQVEERWRRRTKLISKKRRGKGVGGIRARKGERWDVNVVVDISLAYAKWGMCKRGVARIRSPRNSICISKDVWRTVRRGSALLQRRY